MGTIEVQTATSQVLPFRRYRGSKFPKLQVTVILETLKGHISGKVRDKRLVFSPGVFVLLLLLFVNCRIKEEVLDILLAGVSGNKSLVKLYLGNNYLSFDEAMKIATTFRDLKTPLKYVDLENTVVEKKFLAVGENFDFARAFFYQMIFLLNL